MDQFTRGRLKELSDSSAQPAISMYMPTFRAGRDMQRNGVRFRNLLRQAVAQLAERNMTDGAIRQLLAEASSLANNEYWWQRQSDGLALFLAPDRFNHYRVPVHFEERVTVGRRFYLRPLVRLVENDSRFHVLAVTPERVRLFEGTQSSISELEPNGLPIDLRSALNIHAPTGLLQQYSSHAVDESLGPYFDPKKLASSTEADELLLFLRRINTALASYCESDQVPLVFAGPEYLFLLYKQTCKYTGLADTPILMRDTNLTPDELQQHAWAIVSPEFRRAREAAARRFRELAGSDLATDRVPDILSAAAQEQVDTLLLAQGAEHWGVTDEEPAAAPVVGTPDGEPEDLLSRAAVCTLITGGAVYSLPQEQFPNGSVAAALLRHPMASRTRDNSRMIMHD